MNEKDNPWHGPVGLMKGLDDEERSVKQRNEEGGKGQEKSAGKKKEVIKS